MHEVRWFYGYRCEVSIDIGEDDLWHGTVHVPIWHPVRCSGLDDLLVLCCFRGMWMVCVDGAKTRFDAITGVNITASRLRRMQDDWDRLSPYEREYQIW